MENNLGNLIKEQRKGLGLTLAALAAKSGVSKAHLGRIEQAVRYPSAKVLRKIAQPLGLEEKELLSLAGYLSGEEPILPYDRRYKLRTQLDILTNRIIADTHRIKQIIRELSKLGGT